MSVALYTVNYKGRTPSLLSRNGVVEWMTAREIAGILPGSIQVIAFRTYVEMTAGSYRL